MFWIVCDPSSGSTELYLTEIIRSGSLMFVVCFVGVWQCNFGPVVCVCVWYIVPYTHTTSSYDPKHVGVIFNFMSFKFLYNVNFNL